MNDADIRSVLSHYLIDLHQSVAGTLIVEEFGCNDARADLAVINEAMHCYEIKSARDRLDRLSNQIPAYSAVFDQVTLVAETFHVAKAKSSIPHWWGLIEVRSSERGITLKRIRKGRKNTGRSKTDLTKMLWRNEAYALLKEHGKHHGLRTAPIQKMWQAVEGLPLRTIADSVRQAIMQRGGSGFRQPLLQNDGSCPIASSSLDFRATTAELQ